MARSAITKNFQNVLDVLISEDMELKCITQNKIASTIGISSSALSKYRCNTGEAGIDSLAKIADYFNVSTDFLLGRTSISTPDTSLAKCAELIGLSDRALRELRLHASLIDCPRNVTGDYDELMKRSQEASDWIGYKTYPTEKQYHLTYDELGHLRSLSSNEFEKFLADWDAQQAKKIQDLQENQTSALADNCSIISPIGLNDTSTVISELLQHPNFYSEVIPAICNIKAIPDGKFDSNDLCVMQKLFSTREFHQLLVQIATNKFVDILNSIYPCPLDEDTSPSAIDLANLM